MNAMRSVSICASLVFAFAVTTSVAAPAADTFLNLGFGDLMKIKVVSVQRRPTALRSTPAPTHILTAEDIRRSGATVLPDVLRLVPGLHVARASGNTWSISARGFNSGAANKMLVLVDGRSVYSQLHAGVFWDVQNIPLDSIERIEVILGPGGSLWGANAVNGIVNIIRKPAAARPGTAVAVTAGNEDRIIGDVSQGWKMGEADAVAYARYHEFDDMKRVGQSGGADDEGTLGVGGFRVDGQVRTLQWTLSGDAYGGEFGQNSTVSTLTPPSRFMNNDETTVNGANVVGRLRIPVRAGGAVSVQTYWDRNERRIPQLFHEVRNTVQTDVQHELAPIGRHTVTYGAYFRQTHDKVGNSFSVSWDPASETNRIYSVFLQDQFQYTPRLGLTVGSKFEHNDYSGWEVQPSARLGFQLSENQFVWAGVSRAVRTPTRLDVDARLVGAIQAGPTSLEVQGGENFESEKLLAYEAGYRAQPTSRTYLTVSGFYNRYNDLRSIEQSGSQPSFDPVPHLRVPFILDNNLWGESFGGVIAPQYQVFQWWRLKAQYSYLHLRLHNEPGSVDFTTVRTERNDPTHLFTAISSWNLPHRLELDGIVRWVDELRNLNVGDYTAIDLRVGWNASSSVSMELVGRNLFETSHRESNGLSEVEPSVHGKVSCRFL